MAKRRTRKEKETPHYSFTISYPGTHVKGHLGDENGGKSRQNLTHEKAKVTAQGLDIEFIKHDIIKSIILVSLILALELVIYLAVRISVL